MDRKHQLHETSTSLQHNNETSLLDLQIKTGEMSNNKNVNKKPPNET